MLDAGARHWGYHGILYDYISRQLPKYATEARRVIAAHLGGGEPVRHVGRKSVETTMGFGALSGLPMATRSGDVPQDLLFYLLRRKLFDDASLEKMLYEQAGLLGLSGVSGDMRLLQDSPDPRAVAAVEYFVYAMANMSAPMRLSSAGWTPLSSPPVSANTQRPYARRSATNWPGSA